LQLDHYDDLFSQYGKAACLSMMKHVAAIARQNLRPDDVVAVITHHRLGVLLLDTTPETARMVSNRLRWQIAANPFVLPNRNSVGLSVSIAFSRVSGRIADKTLVEDCVAALDGLSAKSANALIEVDEADKRKADAR
jgi:GGDEF domain-containing protein